jgi:hypothetical protein
MEEDSPFPWHASNHMGPLNCDKGVGTAAEKQRESSLKWTITTPPVEPKVCSFPVANFVTRPQFEVPFYFLDRVPKL